ncbi:hypothetical protein KAFR_0D01870 [Kazachstania africana CBS 2517]|uniref:Uncharacterized protein n=1 Tax=Kazachstania africana (strain ATCC 22294 / BCRC 22015 / CBS 2517 / CECT 1963 / NBRC 1671 / NRRL Y-8276) TaxID=1071382 RepID=H2ATY4_KAZAF|nr:hypothetical protein KAFR_0D01870 [Kazachstania africana CBS 2517]CCF57834.1 hypothetical protein KAFR_0D01870 [Kazachstania africana CBS 2517]
MVHFRKKSSASGNSGGNRHSDIKVSKEDAERLKIRTASVHDPILEAVQEAQPFEQAADTFNENLKKRSFFATEDGQFVQPRDVFGQPIDVPDVSNPTRSRDERPLDTIRGFEYAVSGDPYWFQQIETPQLGFHVRQDFYFGSEPTYGNGINYNQTYSEQPVYQNNPVRTEDSAEKKKKRGFFGLGRKKKN